MKVKDRLTVNAKCRLSLPVFTACEGDDTGTVSLMNTFFDRLEKEIVSYTETDGSHVRLYTAENTSWEEDGFRYVNVRLSVRKRTEFGNICTSRRELLCKWRGSKLVSFKASDS